MLRALLLLACCLGLAEAANSYAQDAVAGSDTAFVTVVREAMLKVSQDIASESTATPLHTQRVAFANQCLRSPDVFAPILAQAAAVDGVTDKTATDVAIYNRLSAIWNSYCSQ
jgi:hypothetical protein